MTPEEEQRYGSPARAVLGNPVYQDAWKHVRDRCVLLLESADTPPDKRQRVNDLMVAIASARKYMEQAMAGGKMATEQIERERTFAERVKDKIRSAA